MSPYVTSKPLTDSRSELSPNPPDVDIIIPVYNEGENILAVLSSLKNSIRFRYRVLICYDHDDDTTLSILSKNIIEGIPLLFIKNRGRGVIGAVASGMEQSTAPAVITFPADDDYNAERLNELYRMFCEGSDIVVASRFMKGGYMKGCPMVKASIVRSAAFIAFHVCRLPTRDATNGIRLFSRRVIESFPIESKDGFAYSLELLVKCHRQGWPIAETPFVWHERKRGKSRFRVFRWAPQYLRWLSYSLATTYLGKKNA
jgi:dolichol-phosphate mannosyltransferase